MSISVDLENKIQIENVAEPTILQYFASLNSENFDLTASLFATEGTLYPPFEEGITGATAIATYLHKEAKGMQLYPRQGASEQLEDGSLRYRIVGKVQTPWFGINVAWLFVLNAHKEILSVAIELLASPQELLGLRRN